MRSEQMWQAPIDSMWLSGKLEQFFIFLFNWKLRNVSVLYLLILTTDLYPYNTQGFALFSICPLYPTYPYV